MKKIIFTTAALMAFAFTQAQDGKSNGQTAKGKWLIEANTGNAVNFGNSKLGDTSIHFTSTDGDSYYNFGLDGGYFIMDDLALKVGLGFGGESFFDTSDFSYRIGAKYYAMSNIPLTIDYTGASGDGVEDENGNTPSWLGLGAGYAFFVGNNLSIEPGLRYNMSMNNDYYDKGVFQLNVGFALHF